MEIKFYLILKMKMKKYFIFNEFMIIFTFKHEYNIEVNNNNVLKKMI